MPMLEIPVANAQKFTELRGAPINTGQLEWKAIDDYLGRHYEHLFGSSPFAKS